MCYPSTYAGITCLGTDRRECSFGQLLKYSCDKVGVRDLEITAFAAFTGFFWPGG
jgi:hypothetical protein